MRADLIGPTILDSLFTKMAMNLGIPNSAGASYMTSAFMSPDWGLASGWFSTIIAMGLFLGLSRFLSVLFSLCSGVDVGCGDGICVGGVLAT